MVSDDAAYNSSGGPGGGIGFSFKQTSGGSYAQAGGIRGIKENTTDGNYASALTFYTRPNGGGTTERLRISSAGYVTKPETPSWVLRPSYSSNQTLGSGTHAVGWSSSDNGTHAKAVRLKNVTLSGSGFGNNLHNGQNVGKITVLSLEYIEYGVR